MLNCLMIIKVETYWQRVRKGSKGLENWECESGPGTPTPDRILHESMEDRFLR